jgi:signal transduction histidine kinase
MIKKPTYEELEKRVQTLEKEAFMRKRGAQESLLTSEERPSQIIQGSSIPTFVIDDQHVIIYCNKAFENLIGVSAKEIIGTRKQGLAFYSEDRPILADLIMDNASEEEIARYYAGAYRQSALMQGAYEAECFFPNLGERGKWLYFTAAPLRDAAGKVTGAIETLQDVTERKEAEEALKRSNHELEQFAYVASHDLQEPLRMVASYVQLLARRYRGKLDSDADEFIGFAVDGSTRMQDLINDLLAYSRVGTKGKPFEPTKTESVFDRSLSNLKALIDESGAEVTHDPLPAVMADGAQLIQLFQNLLSNAIKFRGEETPKVHVSADRKQNEWVFSFEDNGIGIDAEFADRIFIIFQRLHSRAQYPGTGIGLAICKKIVKRHGGRIWVKSQPGMGSSFYFTIPAKGDN